jgi:hypothetical protein
VTWGPQREPSSVCSIRCDRSASGSCPPGGSAFALLDDSRLVSLRPPVSLRFSIWKRAKRAAESGISTDELLKPDFFALADRDRLYFVMNSGRQ